jgi:hypothetical protein
MNNEPSQMELRLLTLLQKVRDERDAESRTELNDLLRVDSDARKTMAASLVNEQAIISHLRDQSIVSILNPDPRSTLPPKSTCEPSWLQWSPLWATAAGILFGVLCTSVVFGYAISSLGNTITFLHESFESGPAPLVVGRPDKADVWSGDYSEIVGEQQGVKPESGLRMLRFLRADYEGRSVPESFSSDVFQLIDVRPYRREFADSGAVVQLSAVFNAAHFGNSESYKCGLTIFALDAALVDSELLNTERVLATQSLARSTSSHLHMDRDPSTWQRLANELRVPPNTDYLLIQIGISNVTPPNKMRRDSFAGHFADEVQLVLAHRPEIVAP